MNTRFTFSALEKRLAARYDYLTEGLMAFAGGGFLPGEERPPLRGLLENEEGIFVVLGEGDTSILYPARFGFFTREENEALTCQEDLTLMQAWPQPSVTVGMGAASRQAGHVGQIVGEDRPAKKTKVALKRIGSSQLWWGEAGGTGLLWEAIIDRGGEDLRDYLWDVCEGRLAEGGAERCFTTHRDRDYPTDVYRELLGGRDYQFIDRAEANPRAFPGRALCAVKML